MNEGKLKSQKLFQDKPVWTAIFSMAIPSCITILVMVFYNIADMFFIGQLGDTAQVAAVSVVSPVFPIVAAAAAMLGILCTVIMPAATNPILSLLGANRDIIGYAGKYMRILALGAPAMLLSTTLATLLRADGISTGIAVLAFFMQFRSLKNMKKVTKK